MTIPRGHSDTKVQSHNRAKNGHNLSQNGYGYASSWGPFYSKIYGDQITQTFPSQFGTLLIYIYLLK